MDSTGLTEVMQTLDLSPAVLLRDHELTREQLRGQAWEWLSRGLYGPRVAQRTTAELAAMMSKVLPRDSGFGHLNSAQLRGWWMPNGLRAVHPMFATTTSSVHVQRRGLYVRRSRFADFEHIGGVRVVSAAQTLIELARDLCVIDLVPFVDCALRDGTSVDSILEAARPRLRGTRTLRRAVHLSDQRSESWWESILRLLHVLPGLGPVESQAILYVGGVFLARTDLHLIGTRRYPEYDGGDHRDRDQHCQDLGRDKRMSRLAFERYGYTSDEIARSPGMIIRDAEAARGWPHDPSRVSCWWRAARASTLTPYGRTLLAGRLRRYAMAAERRVAR